MYNGKFLHGVKFCDFGCLENKNHKSYQHSALHFLTVVVVLFECLHET